MNNQHTLIVGQTGAGKTVLVKWLLTRTARAIVHDMNMDYNDLPFAEYASELDEAVSILMRVRNNRFCLVFQSPEYDEQIALLRIAERMQEIEPHGPLVCVIEEASYYSTTHDMDPTIERLYNMGRRLRISLLTIIQVDTSIHRVSRFNSKVIVSVKQNKLSTDFQKLFDEDAVKALTPAAKLPWNKQRMIQGRNFLVYPESVDLFTEWSVAHGYLYR